MNIKNLIFTKRNKALKLIRVALFEPSCPQFLNQPQHLAPLMKSKNIFSTPSMGSPQTKHSNNRTQSSKSHRRTQSATMERRNHRAGKTGGAEVDSQTSKQRSPFAAALFQELHPHDEEGNPLRNTRLRRQIREALGISDTTLYLWQNPSKTPEGRTPMKPDRDQLVKLGMVFAENKPLQSRTEIVNRWLELAGESPDSSGSGEETSSKATADQLSAMYDEAQRLIDTVLFGKRHAGFAAIAVSSFFSQRLIEGQIGAWQQKGDGGHVMTFFRWQSGSLMKRFAAKPWQSLSELFTKLTGGSHRESGIGSGVLITIFIVVDDESLEEHEELKLREQFRTLPDEVKKSLVVYVEQPAINRPQHLADIWLFISPSLNIPIQIVDYDQVHAYLLTLPPQQQAVIQRDFNPFAWASCATILEASLIPRFLKHRHISPPIPGTRIEFMSNDRWKHLSIE
ncbi:MAG: hypothetical protein JNM99_10630 [Verrucomicrobiaceae bacterium]|nr:hypothetical protein [Verrucomicrobiaceae bacterium]